MNNTYKKFIILPLALMIVFSPTTSFAKEKVEKHKKRDNDKSEQVEKKHCFKAFGHLIAPGFIKNHGELSFSQNCFIPYGIMKKLNRGTATTTTATTTPDTKAPMISNISIVTGTTTANIIWLTNENTSSKVYFSTTSPVNLSATTTSSVENLVMRKVHSVFLSNLSASTTYYFAIESKDKSGNKTISTTSPATTK